MDWVAENVSDSSARTLRRLQIVNRAAHALEGQQAAKSLPPIPADASASSPSPGAATASDWITKFWDDAGLVSDQLVQEIYARILVGEAAKPGTCSLRTLRTLRYMDRLTAERFKMLLRGVISASWVPNAPKLLDTFEIPFDTILDLNDAGLVDSNGSISKTIAADPLLEQYGPWVIRAEGFKGVQVPVYVLTAAGRELAKVAEVSRNSDDLLSIAEWIGTFRLRAGVTWAPLPPPGQIVQLESLQWQSLP